MIDSWALLKTIEARIGTQDPWRDYENEDYCHQQFSRAMTIDVRKIFVG
jgi:hypothetical protein